MVINPAKVSGFPRMYALLSEQFAKKGWHMPGGETTICMSRMVNEHTSDWFKHDIAFLT